MRKLFIRIFNLLFLVITAVSITCFATKDLVALNLSYPLSQEVIVDTLAEQFEDQISREDLEETFKDGLDLNIEVNISSTALFKSIKDKNAVSENIKGEINRNVDNLVGVLTPPLKGLIEKVAKATAKEQATQSIKDQIASCLPKDKEGQADDVYNKYVDDADVTKITDDLYDQMLSGEATVDSLVDNMAGDINKILNDIKTGEEALPEDERIGFVYKEFDPNSKEGGAIKEALNDALDTFGLVDSEGKITDADTALAILVDTILNNPDALGGLMGGGGSSSIESSNDDNPPVINEDVPEEGDKPEKGFITRDPLDIFPFILDSSYAVSATESIDIHVADAASVHSPFTFTVVNDDPVGCLTVVAKGDNDATLTGVSAGHAQFYVSCEGYEDSTYVDVTVNVLEPKITFADTPLKVDFGKTKKLSVTKNAAVDPSTPVVYSLSDVMPEGCITLEGDVLTGVAEGSAKVTATCGELSITEEVTCRQIKPINEQIRNFINEKIEGAQIYEMVDKYGVYGVFLPIAAMLPWALFALVTIIRTSRKGKCWTKPWIVFFFASSQLIFGFPLTLLFGALKPTILGALGSVEMIAPYLEMIEPLNLAITTSCLIPSILYAAMIILTIVYMILCRKQKKAFKKAKKERKAAKKAA